MHISKARAVLKACLNHAENSWHPVIESLKGIVYMHVCAYILTCTWKVYDDSKMSAHQQKSLPLSLEPESFCDGPDQ